MTFETIETERLILRKLTDESIEDILVNSSTADISRLLNLKGEEIEREKEKAINGFSTFNKSLLIFQLIEKNSNGIIGWCGYHTWYLDHHRAEIGYALDNDGDRSKGYMTEAIQAILAFGFGEMGLNRVEAFVGPQNVPSLRLLQRMGFVEEGTLRNHYLKNGDYEDSVLFSLLSSEFLKRIEQ